MSTPFSYSALKAELTTDPAALGYAAPLAAKNLDALAALLNAATYGTAYLPPSPASVLKWGAATGVLTAIAEAAAAAGTFASISAANRAIALATQLLLGGTYPPLDVTDPAIAGAVASGAPYTPGAGAVTTPGLLDALVGAGVLTSTQKDQLISLGAVAAGRATALWCYSAATNPAGPPSLTITADQIGAALRS